MMFANNMTMKHYKYIHFFWRDDLKFTPRVVEMVNNPEYGFSSKEHLFVTPYKDVYEALAGYDNVVLWNAQDPHSAQMVNYYAPYGDWLFLHSIPGWRIVFNIKKKYKKKIIWRTWGHDAVLRDEKNGSLIRRFMNKIFNFMRIREVRSFYAVGVSSNYIDDLDIREKFGNVKTLCVPYVNKAKYIPVDSSSQGGILNIMVGHSGYKEENHINILEKLKRFKNENICIYLIFSYADSVYMKKVVDYVRINWPQKVNIVTKFVPLEEYKRFCSKMDIGIFDWVNSYAIGNVGLLFTSRKKLIFNRKGLWHKAFVDKEAPHMCTDELDSISFEQLKKPSIYSKAKYEGLDIKPFEEYIKGWRDMLNTLDLETLKRMKS